MKSILLGHDTDTGHPVQIPLRAFDTHVHMPGATGKGKTTAMLTMLYQLLRDPRNQACHVIVDFLGGLSHQLAMWLSSRYCPPRVRERVVIIQPSREDVCLPMNPLLYDTPNHGYFKVSRATELILRAWESQNVEAMPQLTRWLFNSFWAIAQLGLAVIDTEHLLIPGSEFHQPMLDALPPRLRGEWHEILQTRSGEAVRILNSSRNRMKPFYDGILRSMFGSTVNRFNVLRFMQQGKIVILNLDPGERLSPQVQDAIAGLAINEIFSCARSLPKHVKYPTYLWLDEFQRLITPDIALAIPEVRQLGIKLILAHQSFSQLKCGDTDLTSIIWQPQTRIAFGEQGEDADILAHEFATLKYNPKEIKDELYSLKQLEVGKEIVTLSGWNTTHGDSENWNEAYGHGWSAVEGLVHKVGDSDYTMNENKGNTGSNQSGRGGGRSVAHGESSHQQLVSKLDTIEELSRRTYYTFDEKRTEWARDVRELRTGFCVYRPVDDALRRVHVKETKPGHLGLSLEVLVKRFPQALEAYEKLLEQNFQDRELFIPPHVIESETRERLQQVLRPTIYIPSEKPASTENPDSSEEPADETEPFA